MSTNQKIFHESWYQIANQKISLRASVRIKRQIFRGSQWYVLHDPFTNQFYRLRQNVYEFIARLNAKKTVEEVWHQLLENSPEKAPGQGEIIDLLAQLYHANLLHYNLAPDSTKLFNRFKKRRQNLVKMNLMNILFARIPLYDPHNLLKFLKPLIRIIISPLGFILWSAVIGIGIKTVFDNFKAIQVQTDGILAPSNLFLLYIAVALIKVIHELGHAFAVKRYGGEVHTMGIMFMMLTPLPYTDASASISFRSKWKRVLVGSAGMIFELFIAAIAVLIWANTGEGLLHSLCYNVLFAASVTTLLFNINPLMRYDGYYILADILEMPNLQRQATQQLTYLLERYIFGRKNTTSHASTTWEAWFLPAYAVACFLYRITIFTGILLFISQKLLLLAIVMGILIFMTWIVVPIGKFIKYLISSPNLARVRGRAVRITALTALAVFAFLNYVPFPYSFKAPGILKAVGYINTVNPTGGQVKKLGKPSGTFVSKNDTLLILENVELQHQYRMTEAALLETKLKFNKALNNLQADMEPLQKRMAALSDRLKHLEIMISDLTVKAQIEGIWVAPDVDDYTDRWLPRGTRLGRIINPESFYFASVISQREVSELFSQKIEGTDVKLKGQSNLTLKATNLNTIPMEQNQLPSQALGFSGGGEIEIVPGDTSGRRTVEPFYEVRAMVENESDVMQLHGRSGKMRFSLGYRPLLWQIWRKILQLVQKHYRI